MFTKVVDCGTYTLCDYALNTIAQLKEEYVPHGVVPGEDGDYIELNIDKNGIITNWPKNPDVSKFFPED